MRLNDDNSLSRILWPADPNGLPQADAEVQARMYDGGVVLNLETGEWYHPWGANRTTQTIGN